MHFETDIERQNHDAFIADRDEMRERVERFEERTPAVNQLILAGLRKLVAAVNDLESQGIEVLSYSSDLLNCRRPKIHLSRFADFQRLFAGSNVRREISDKQNIHHVVRDGVAFVAVESVPASRRAEGLLPTGA